MKGKSGHWELLGAVVGAGMASGREIASFFARYGRWSWSCITLTVGVILLTADAGMPAKWEKRWPGRLWRGMTTLLLIATGGGMLAGAGEIAVMVLPGKHACWSGMMAAMLLAWILVKRTASGLAWVSRGLLAVLAVLIVLGLLLPPLEDAKTEALLPAGLLGALAYGGFSAALMSPVLAMAEESPGHRRRSLALAGGMLALLLMLGNAVLQRHPALLEEPLPFVRMSAGYGMAGYALAIISLALAILSTLTASVKVLRGRPLALLGMAAAAMCGFSGVVGVLYPVLGGGCLVLMAAAKFTNSR